jgi:hypothetical protein
LAACHALTVTRIALVADRQTAELHSDGPLLLEAFAAIGIEAETRPWGNGAWDRYDAAVVRTTWDYVFDRKAFLEWAAEVSATTRLANSLTVLEWNTDKRYLRGLEAAGIPTVPTLWVEPDHPAPQPDWDAFVVKPSVSAGARLSARHVRGDDIDEHVRRIHAEGAAAMIQPYLQSIDAEGETGTYLFGGEVSHAIRKGQALQRDRGPLDDMSAALEQSVEPAEIDPALADFARRVLALAPPLLYARVDTATGPNGETVLLELEATEPFLFLEHAPAAADRFAAAVRRWLDGG